MKNLEDKQSLLEGHTLEIDYFQGKYLANLTGKQTTGQPFPNLTVPLPKAAEIVNLRVLKPL